ncbi:MAG TPA: ABC transporter ATP-binding protein [Acidimicrobiia bacterium]|nr:ABC transporter ATP-binding protein [Acidimicrobiia bacterium]
MLELRGIRAGYGRLPVLFDLDLTVDAGEWLTVVGANGAGRSTLLKTILGVTNLTAGEIVFGGERITHLSSNGRIARGVAMVPEGRRIFPNLSVRENLRTGANTLPRRELSGELAKVYDVFPILGSRATQRAGSLSGGEQQMLAVGRALMSRPKLLLVDELSLGLAPLVVATLTEALQKLCAEGLAVVVVDEVHVHTTAAASSRRLVLEKGRFVSNPAVEAERFATVL